MIYEDLDYAIQRLKNTYIQTKEGKLFYVENLYNNEDNDEDEDEDEEDEDGNKKDFIKKEIGPIRCFGQQYESNGEYFYCNYDLKELDLTPIPLGFINLKKDDTAVYATRIPIRKYWRQGLGPGNLHLFTFYSYQHKGSFPNSNDLIHTFYNKYPSLEQTLNTVDNSKIKAFHRNWALSKQDLFYRYKQVGNINKNKLILLDKYFYLSPFLDEVLNEENK